ncbi:hypothetical protein LCM19_05610 [Qipengyuania flava]|nr:hypothetical protein [Qipengyuania flava]
MAFNAVKIDEQIELQSGHEPFNVEESDKASRYTLAIALGVVQRMETSPSRAAVFEEIKEKNSLYRLVDRLYETADTRLLKPLFLFAYMLKCVAFTGPCNVRGSEKAVSVSQFPNEHRTIDRVAALVPDIGLIRVTSSPRRIFSCEQWWATFSLLLAAARIFPFLKVIARSYSFMPSARIASALAFYLRFSRLFNETPSLEAAVVASNYSPEAVGMAAAAHRNGRRVVYANHAPVPANAAFIPPVLADCALVYGEAMAKTYSRLTRCSAEMAFVGQPGSSRPMQWSGKINSVGIFLTAGTRADVLQSLIASIRLNLPSVRIIIRQHPVSLLKTDFAAMGLSDLNVELTFGSPLGEDIAECDLVICGNSGVALNVVSEGRPVAYLSSLDDAQFDTLGFVQSRLVYSMPWWTEDLYDRLKAFYQTAGWEHVMRSYDAAYLVDRATLNAAARTVLLRHLVRLPNSTTAISAAKTSTGRSDS